MFLRAGALSLALLLASRLLGVVRESVLAASFGTSGLADVAVLALALPDWIVSVLASGALAYVLLPAWAGTSPEGVAALQRRVAGWLVGGSVVLALVLFFARDPVARWLVAGIPPALRPAASAAMAWSAVAVPAALLAALWATRLQHERDFTGMYGANLVVNAVLVAGLAWAGSRPDAGPAVTALGVALLAAMLLRLAWLAWRHPSPTTAPAAQADTPPFPVWLWALLGAGLPLALPFAARSAASLAGEGALATFNYAWKLVELPLILAVQLVASLAFPAIARAFAESPPRPEGAMRQAFALAWCLACAAIAALVVGSEAIAALLFGWGRMPADAVAQVARWGLAGSWGLLPQAVTAVALTALAAQRRLRPAAAAYAVALSLVLVAATSGVTGGLWLMQVLNAGYTLVAIACLAALGRPVVHWLPWRAMAWPLGLLAATAAAAWQLPAVQLAAPLPGLLAAAAAGSAVLLLSLWRSPELRQALRR
jgi:peptidoglycan biosynthesis protein MviN/MurJ (putative lipid II flippase)